MLMLYEPNETVWWTPFFIWIPEVFGSAPAACVALRQYATNLYACAVRLRLKLPSRRDRSSPQLCTISACSQTLLFQQKIYEIWVSVTVENREGMNPFSNESSCHIMEWVLIIPHGVFSHLWSCVILTKRISICNHGSLSENVLPTPWWGSGTSLQALDLDAAAFDSYLLLISRSCISLNTHTHTHTFMHAHKMQQD